MKTPLHNPTIREADEATRAEQEARRRQFMSTDHVDPDLAGYDARRPTAVPNIENHWAIGRRRMVDDSSTTGTSGTSNENVTAAVPLDLIHHDLMPAYDLIRVAGVALGSTLDQWVTAMTQLTEAAVAVHANPNALERRHGYRELRSGGRGKWWDRRSIDNQPLNRLPD